MPYAPLLKFLPTLLHKTAQYSRSVFENNAKYENVLLHLIFCRFASKFLRLSVAVPCNVQQLKYGL